MGNDTGPGVNERHRTNGSEERVREWQARLAVITAGILLFLTLSGLSVWLLPFGVSNQVMVLAHTVLGVLFLVPCCWYLVRHLVRYWRSAMSHVQVLGYLGGAALLVAMISGGVLTWEAIFARRISYGWDLAHIISTLAIVGFLLPHILAIVRIARQARLAGGTDAIEAAAGRFGRGANWIAAAGLVLVLLGAYAYTSPRLTNQLPADYSFKYGEDRPFAPSLATTSTGTALDARLFSGSQSCGTSGCHEEIVKEWQSSAHRYSAMDAGFQAIQSNMAKQNGPESTRYCGGCHDPISLFSGAKNLFVEPKELTSLHGYQEGVSCLICHSVRKVDLKGNAQYVIAPPPRYMFELEYDAAPTEATRWMRDFLIRAYPEEHVEALSKHLFKTPEYCAACHKQFVDKEINQVGWVQLQNQYDNWRQSRWNQPGKAEATIECRECHMPLEDSGDPAAGDPYDYNRTAGDKKHRSHRFVAANAMMPAILKLEGWEKQVQLTEKWLRGEYQVPEITQKWTNGPAVAIEVEAPEKVRPIEKFPIKVIVTSNKVGHDFPTGPLDIIQAWLAVEVTDANGKIVFSSGQVDDRGFIEPGAFMFKAEPVDQHGNLIDRHNLWEMVGVRYRRSLFPGFSDTAEYSVEYPPQLKTHQPPVGPLEVRVRLRYRKVDQYLLNFIFGEEAGLTAPITDMAEARRTLQVEAAPRNSSPERIASTHPGSGDDSTP